jgi:undecaprenyl-diphosphatase
MTQLQALLIAILQGATELFPVSSLGHAVLVPALLGWNIDMRGVGFLPFLVLLHTATATALLAYFWRDWWALAVGVFGLSTPQRVRESRHILLLLVVATLPAMVLGAGLEHMLRRLFAAPLMAALFLTANGLLLLFGERLRGRMAQAAPRAMATLTAKDALVIGLWQCLALLPGISRSGATIVGGLLRGIDHAGAAHFSFLIATPIIIGATLFEVPKMLHAQLPLAQLEIFGIAAAAAGLVAFASTAFLMRYFRGHDNAALDPYACYCLAAGLLCAGYFAYF